MIAEGFLIVQLLEKLSLRSTPPTVGPPQWLQRKKPTKPKTVPPPRGMGLFNLGKIEEIKQPLIIDSTKIDYGQLDWKPNYKKGKF